MDDRGGPLCELIDGTLVEKTMGYYEAWLAGNILYFVRSFLEGHYLGIVTGADGFLKLFPKQVRASYVTFIRRQRLPEGRVPRSDSDAGSHLADRSHFAQQHRAPEMQRKLHEYFAAGAELVWYIYPQTQSAIVYTAPEQPTEIGPDGVLGGGEVLPGFELSLRRLFSESENL